MQWLYGNWLRFSIFLLYFIFSISSAFVSKLAIGSSRSDSTGLTIGYLVDRVFHFALFNSVFRFVNMSATFVESTRWPPNVCIEKIKILFLVLIYATLRINSFGQFGYCHCAVMSASHMRQVILRSFKYLWLDRVLISSISQTWWSRKYGSNITFVWLVPCRGTLLGWFWRLTLENKSVLSLV